MSELDDAQKYLAAGDAANAFEALLTAWRGLRVTEIAELCEQLSAIATEALPSFEGRTHNDRLVAWAEAFRAHTPLALGPLLADFAELATSDSHGSGGVQPRFVFPRADELSSIKDDPRIAPVMVRALAAINGGSKWQKVMLRYFRAIEASGDPRAIAGLEAILDKKGALLAAQDGGLRTFAFERGPEVVARLRERFNPLPSLPDDLRDAVRDLKTQIATLDPKKINVAVTRAAETHALGDPESLLSAVYANPADESLRMVLADALTSRGDPRGELIVLQIRRKNGESNAKTIAREKQIIKAHGKALLGPLASVVQLRTAIFEGGFLEECHLSAKTAATAVVHAKDPEWATVTKIHFHGISLITPAMRSLREAGPINDAALKQLATTGHPTLMRLEIADSTFMKHGAPGTPAARAFAKLTTLPSLRQLILYIGRSEWRTRENASRRATDFDWIWTTPWGPSLTHLEVECAVRIDDWEAVFREREHLIELTIHLDRDIFATLKRSAADTTDIDAALHYSNPLVGVSVAPIYVVRSLVAGLDRFARTKDVRCIQISLGGAGAVAFDEDQRAEIARGASTIPNVRKAIFPWDG